MMMITLMSSMTMTKTKNSSGPRQTPDVVDSGPEVFRGIRSFPRFLDGISNSDQSSGLFFAVRRMLFSRTRQFGRRHRLHSEPLSRRCMMTFGRGAPLRRRRCNIRSRRPVTAGGDCLAQYDRARGKATSHVGQQTLEVALIGPNRRAGTRQQSHGVAQRQHAALAAGTTSVAVASHVISACRLPVLFSVYFRFAFSYKPN